LPKQKNGPTICNRTGRFRRVVRQPNAANLPRTLALFQMVDQPSFPLALAILLHSADGSEPAATVFPAMETITDESERLTWLLQNQHRWPKARSMHLVAIATAA